MKFVPFQSTLHEMKKGRSCSSFVGIDSQIFIPDAKIPDLAGNRYNKCSMLFVLKDRFCAGVKCMSSVFQDCIRYSCNFVILSEIWEKIGLLNSVIVDVRASQVEKGFASSCLVFEPLPPQ